MPEGLTENRRTGSLFPEAAVVGDVGDEFFKEFFKHSLSGMLIYRWEDRSDVGSFRLTAVNTSATIVAPVILDQVGERLRDTTPQLLDTPVPGYYADAIRNGTPREWTIAPTYRFPPKVFRACCFPLGGDYVGVQFQDITEQKRAEDEVQRQLVELERSNRELDEFAYVASHDLKSPLQDVRNLATWISEDLGPDLNADTARHVRTMVSRVNRMERLLDDLLDYSRVGREGVAIQEFSFVELVEEVVALSQFPAGYRLEIDAQVRSIRAPKAPLAKVLRNLLGNAVKHHDRDQGAIAVRAEPSDNDRIEISVSDDGPGIPAEFHERVFRIFQTLRPRDQVEGSGVGLAIVKKAVEAHGGRVLLDSRGRGTTVRFTWPRNSEI